jgi:hypothetical protein
MITGSAAGEIQQYRVTQLQKSCNGKTLEFKASAATVTLTIEEAHTPPRLHLVAQVFVPIHENCCSDGQTPSDAGCHRPFPRRTTPHASRRDRA